MRVKQFISILLSIYLVLFLIDAGLSILDDSLILFLNIHFLGVIRGITGFFDILAGILIYLLLGLTPTIPKRFFLPLTLFFPLAVLVVIFSLAIGCHDKMQQVTLLLSICQGGLGSAIFCWIRGGLTIQWPLVRFELLENKTFGWLNLSGFLFANIFLIPVMIFLYLALCASLALDHFSRHFMVMHPGGLAVRATTYVRNDGKTIYLVPMMHIGQSDFYHQISKSFPTNAIVLLEGVTDQKHRLKNRLSYQRMASSLGLSEQPREFSVKQRAVRRADLDLDQFSNESVDLIDLIAGIHSKGLNVATLIVLMQKSQDASFEERIWEDLLTKRNDHLLKEIQRELDHYDSIVVPWGALHMPGIAAGIEKSGFKPTAVQEYSVVRFQTILKHLIARRQKKIDLERQTM